MDLIWLADTETDSKTFIQAIALPLAQLRHYMRSSSGGRERALADRVYKRAINDRNIPIAEIVPNTFLP